MDYFEKDLEIPFLKVLSENRTGLPMSSIKTALLGRLNPTGSCAEPSPTRTGEIKLQQRIGNFTPRRERRLFTKGYVTYDDKTGIYQITDLGLRQLNNNEEIYDSLISQGFPRKQREEEEENDFKDVVIEEGSVREVSVKQRKRSDKLRREKIKEVKEANDGRLPCIACGFEFENKYGETGKNFIHIHHLEPIKMIEEFGGRVTNLQEALKKVVPLCSNCHSIIHRNIDKQLSIDELKKILKENSD